MEQREQTHLPEDGIRRQRNLFSKIFFAVLIVAAVVIVILVATSSNPPREETKTDTDTTTETQDDTKEPAKTDTTKPADSDDQTDTDDSETVEGKTPSQNEGDDANASGELTGAVNYAAVVDDELVIRVSIDQYLSGGVCSLALTSAVDSYETTAAIEPGAATSSCGGFNIPLSQLMNGTYTITVKLSSGDKTGTVKGEVEV